MSAGSWKKSLQSCFSTKFSIDALCQHRIKLVSLAMAELEGHKQELKSTGACWAGRGEYQVGGLDALLKALLPATRAVDAVTAWIGKRLAWLILAAVVVSAINATVRKVFDISSNSWLELQWVLFSMVFLLCSPWTLLANEHIRIDIVNNLLPMRVRNS